MWRWWNATNTLASYYYESAKDKIFELSCSQLLLLMCMIHVGKSHCLLRQTQSQQKAEPLNMYVHVGAYSLERRRWGCHEISHPNSASPLKLCYMHDPTPTAYFDSVWRLYMYIVYTSMYIIPYNRSWWTWCGRCSRLSLLRGQLSGPPAEVCQWSSPGKSV